MTGSPLDQVYGELLQAGLLGCFVLIFGLVIVWLYREMKTERALLMQQIALLQAERVRDAQLHRDQIVEIVRQSNLALSNATNTLESQREAMMELRNAFREVAEEMRTLSERVVAGPPHHLHRAGTRG